MTPVTETDYKEYSFHQGRGDIKDSQRRGQFLYYYVQNPVVIHGPLPGGEDGHTTEVYVVTERYKLNLTNLGNDSESNVA